MEEKWAKIKGFPHYFVSDKGRVKSCKREKERILLPRKDKNGYLRVNLISGAKKHVTCQIHRLVTRAFLTDGVAPPSGIVANHKNWDIEDNRLENLELVTVQQNGIHRNPALKTSIYSGVSWDKKREMWSVNKLYKGKQVHLGRYYDEEEAGAVFENITEDVLQFLADKRNERSKLQYQIDNMLASLGLEKWKVN